MRCFIKKFDHHFRTPPPRQQPPRVSKDSVEMKVAPRRPKCSQENEFPERKEKIIQRGGNKQEAVVDWNLIF